MANGFTASVPPIFGEPSPYGLLGGCVDVVDTTDLHELNGTTYQSVACNQAHPWEDCPPESRPNPVAKTFDRPGICTFDPVTLQAGVLCSTIGLSWPEAKDRALEQLRLGEQRGLEQWFMENWLCANAVDLTPAAGALHIAQGVGVLESWLGTEYGGQGVLHVPAGAASLLSHARVTAFPGCDGCLTSPTTLMGNCVVLGAGYSVNVGPANPGPGCSPAPAGEAWLYITGPIRVRRDAPLLTPDTESASVNTNNNDRRAMAESTFVVEVACCDAAAVRVSLAACP